MSTDETVTKDLIETLEDGKDGFEHAARMLDDASHAGLAAKFREWSAERAEFSKELRDMAKKYGDHIDEDGSVAAALHRKWMTLKDAISGSDAKGILDAAEQGEDHAVAEYRKALEHDDLSDRLRAVVDRQSVAVNQAHEAVRSLRDEVAG